MNLVSISVKTCALFITAKQVLLEMKWKGAVVRKEDYCTCGHSKFDHASSLNGDIGGCMKEIIPGWEWCECVKFERHLTPVPADSLGTAAKDHQSTVPNGG